MPNIPLISRQNLLAFPNRNPGFDPGHVALTGGGVCRFSGVATLNKGMVNLLTGKGPDTVTATPVQKIVQFPGILQPSTTAGGFVFTSGINFVSDTVFTIAIIVYSTSLGTNNRPFGFGTTSTNGYSIQINTSGLPTMAVGATTGTFAITLAVNIPYFLVMGRSGTGTSLSYCLAKRLDTGAVLTATKTTSTAETTPTQVSIQTISNNNNHILGACAYIGGGAPSLTLYQELANDAWSFWYPYTVLDSLNWMQGFTAVDTIMGQICL